MSKKDKSGQLDKDKAIEYKKQYYLDNKDRLAKKAKQYRILHKEKAAEYHKQYWKQNKEKLLEQKKQYYLDNKKKLAEKAKQYRLKNKEKIAEQKKQYQLNNKDKIAEKDKQYYLDNKNKILERNKQYRLDNKSDIAEQKKQYYLDNKENLLEYYKQYRKARRKIDPEFKLREIVSNSIRNALKRNDSSKMGETYLKYLPYTIKELKHYLEKQFEPWMNWDNHGRVDLNNRTWQIDHKEAQSKLPYDTMEHPNFIKCWTLSNLQPLEAFENIKKGNKDI